MSGKTLAGKKRALPLAKGSPAFTKLNLGSGYTKLKGFISIDIDKTCEPDIVDDIRTLKNIPSNSVDVLRCSHTLEHIYQNELFGTLRTFHRVLKPGGNIIIIVPDIFHACKQWVEQMITDKMLDWIILGSDPSATPFQQHRNILYESKLERFLFITGFVDIHFTPNWDLFELEATARKSKEGLYASY